MRGVKHAFLATEARLLAAGAALGLFLTACSHASDSGISAYTDHSRSIVTFSIAADPMTLNPLFLHQDASSVEQQLARLAFEPFIDLDERGRPVPALLSSIPARDNGGLSADGRTIVYHLRPSVRWSDGVPVTSDDVLFTLHAIVDPRNPVRSHEGYNLIDQFSAPDAHTVIFHLRHAWAPAVMTYFSYGFAPQFVLPAHILKAQMRGLSPSMSSIPLNQIPFNTAPTVGDGPYSFAAWHHGDNLTYVANQRYWRGKPNIPQLNIRIVPDPQTNLVLLRSGQLDWNLIAPSQEADVTGASGITVTPAMGIFRVPTSVIAGIVLNTKHSPLDDVRVRRAIAMSIDRDAISQKITLGAYPVTNMLQPQFSWAYNPAIKEPSFNTGDADRLLDQAGWRCNHVAGSDSGCVRSKSGKRLELTYVQFPETTTGVRVATVVQEELRARGFDITLKSISNAQLFLPRTGVLASGEFDLAYVPFTMGADPDDSSILACNGASNYMRWCNAKVGKLESLALTATSRSERKRYYTQIAGAVDQEVPLVFLFNAYYIYAYRGRLHNFMPNAFLPTWNAYNWKLY